MPIFDLKCSHCDHELKDQWLKSTELPTSTESETKCDVCNEGYMFRVIAAPQYHWHAGEYGGDASRVNRFEFISKDVETVDVKKSTKEKQTVLKRR